MDEKYYTELAVRVQDVDSRTKSNTHRLDNHDKEIKEIKDKQDAIYDLTSSVKSIATDMAYIKEDVKEVKVSQKELAVKVNEIENKPAIETKKKIEEIKDKIIWLVVGGVAVYLLTSILPNIKW